MHVFVFTVSYFGDSYCVLKPFQDVSTFELSLLMKTNRRNGLLLLAAGTDDYLFLELHNGKVQARMNLGVGEVILSSTPGVQLNNLLDHKISLKLTEDTLTMTIDETFSTYVPISPDGEELNIDVGIWLGGTGNLDASYLSNAIPPFRGCMTDVKFESHRFDILSNAFKECHDTKESCSSEFEAADGETTSFTTPQSFISFPTWSKATGGSRTLEFLMKTTIEDALLAFHPGLEDNFIAIGVMGGYIKGIVDFGNGMEVIDNTHVQVEDDQWHRVQIQITEKAFEVHVDSQVASLPLDSSQKLDLVGNLYLGGIQEKMKEVFRESGSLSRAEEEVTAESFIGCMGEIKVNNKDRSLQDALVTKDIHIKCEGEEYDYSNYDDEETVTTAPPVFIGFDQTELPEQHCFPDEHTPGVFKNVTKLLDVSPLLVPEGGEVFIGIKNLNPTFDLSAAGMQKSQIMVTLKTDPFYGLVDINTNNKRFLKFTLQDLLHADQIQMDVVAQGIDNLPECLKSPQSYLLPVEIIPVNDIPQFSGGEITITERGRTKLSPSLIKILETDTRCDGLVVTVTSEPPLEVGYLENDRQPGVPITEFTCRDLKDGKIYFVHKGGDRQRNTLEVSDGQSESHSATFNLVATTPHMKIVTNTGLTLTQGSNASIGIQNLALISNPRNGDILFNITQPLLYGKLNVMTDYGVYKQVTSFHQSDLEQERIRYFSTDSTDQEDIVVERIQFNAHLGHYTLWNNTFMVNIMPAQVKVSTLVPLEVYGGEMKMIKQAQLLAEVKGERVNPELVKYVLVTPPTLGVLQLLDTQLGEGDVFTQMDILDNTLSYKVRVQRAVDNVDSFQFRVVSQDKYSPCIHAPVLTNEMLTVLQGGEETINKNYLWVHTPEMGDFVYQITQGPKHGRIMRESPPGMPRFEGAIRIFSNEDLELDRSDEFHFSAFDQEAQGSYDHETIKSIFKITIQTKNDHVPVRVVDKVLNVVRHGQRLLTTDVIQFKDEDSGFNDSQIVYAREGILSGNIVSAINPSQPLFRFTQADMRDKKVLFVHHGADQERFSLQVSDGFHKTTAILQIQASEPYLRLVNNTMIVIDHGATKTLNTTLLSAETNLDITDDSEITFRITSAPEDGRIIVSGIEASEFTQEDLKKGVVSYEHNYESLKSKDSFTFEVQAEEKSEQGTFKIKVFKQGYRSEPQVTNHDVIISYEGEHTVITQDHLKVEQADILPTDMVFTVKVPPRLGHVVKMTNGSDADSPVLDYIHSFTQDDIDSGRILYVSAYIQLKEGHVYYMHDSSETTEDSFTLSASAYEIDRRSLAFTIAVTVQPVNDEPPKLTRNTGLEVLFGEEADITANMLQTQDDDTAAVHLVYHVERQRAAWWP
ncbi:hypothetical protein WMY93_023760 [Mugilogobius chulae]|uniref:Laminin G domain-containing protein n=1 Tax=Mugilogobius chulae TaxID=88201 RepID=A0AAW0NHC5_9GOBI